jgi:hypothetical protein
VRSPLFDVLKMLEQRRIHFFIARGSHDSITVFATTVGKRIEVFVNEDGEVDFSVFRGNEDVVSGQEALTAEHDSD